MGVSTHSASAAVYALDEPAGGSAERGHMKGGRSQTAAEAAAERALRVEQRPLAYGPGDGVAWQSVLLAADLVGERGDGFAEFAGESLAFGDGRQDARCGFGVGDEVVVAPVCGGGLLRMVWHVDAPLAGWFPGRAVAGCCIPAA